MSKVDLDRFEDALSVRAAQSAGFHAGANYAYMTGYLLSLIRELSYFSPEVAERIKLSIQLLEEGIQNPPEKGYMVQ